MRHRTTWCTRGSPGRRTSFVGSGEQARKRAQGPTDSYSFALYAELLLEKLDRDGGPSEPTMIGAHRDAASLVTHAVRYLRIVETVGFPRLKVSISVVTTRDTQGNTCSTRGIWRTN